MAETSGWSASAAMDAAGATVGSEAARLASLYSYNVLDTVADPRIDVFVRAAAQIYDVPISMVSLVDKERTWFKASVGLEVPELPRGDTFCAQAIRDGQTVMVVEDTRKDPRFADNVLVHGEGGLHFYAGAPINSPEGHTLGTLCILDRKARTLDEASRQRLADLATGVGAVLDLHRSATRLKRAATHDALTGLANRALFDGALMTAMAAPVLEATDQAKPDAGARCALLCLDLDGFKLVNDRFGHDGGDIMLRAAGERLRASIRRGDLAARLGGDEFVVLLAGPVLTNAIIGVAQRIMDAFAQPVTIEGMPVPIRTSIGYASAPHGTADGPALLRAADSALYRAKEAGRGTIAGPLEIIAARSTSLLDDLRAAAAKEGFHLAWQPSFDLRSGAMVGAEALVRWTRPGFGPVSPDLFLPLAEGNDLAQPIEAWILTTACAEAASWRQKLNVLVNLTESAFFADNCPRRIAAALAVSGLEPGRLVLEIDENTVLDTPDQAQARIAELRALGIRIAVESFGSGASMLACLPGLALDEVKLDRLLLDGLGQGQRIDKVVRAMIQIGHAVADRVCAEGIDTVEQLNFLRDAGCELGQGVLLARPRPDPFGADSLVA